jgi:hypothetical protein
MDGDRIVPADGASLLAALGQAQEGLLSRDRPAARAALAAFVSRVQALIDAGVLATGDGQPPTEAAALLAASLRSAGGMDG